MLRRQLALKNSSFQEEFMGTFAVTTGKTGIKFDLKAGNGEIIASSSVYSSTAACRKGIESVRRNAVDADLEDQTEEGFTAAKHPKFELYADKAGEFRFRLKAKNGEVIAVSEGYKSKSSCLNGIESVRKNAPDADIFFVEP
jgi:uncharacterized protein YegP (UPF0339 family)